MINLTGVTEKEDQNEEMIEMSNTKGKIGVTGREINAKGLEIRVRGEGIEVRQGMMRKIETEGGGDLLRLLKKG